MEGEIEKFIKVWITAITSLCYCYYVVALIRKGMMRLLSLLPIFYLFIILPWKLNSINFGALTIFFLVWLGNFKLLLFAFDQGPLTPLPPKLFHFICLACLPIKTKQHPPPKPHVSMDHNPLNTKNPSHQNAKKVPRSILMVIKVLLFAMIIRSYESRQNMHPHLLLALYCVHIYVGVEIGLALAAAPARACGFELERQFDEPYLATSLQDFWGRRWNLMVTSILRPTVYDPIRRISMHIVGPRWAPLPAVIVSFLVSGLMHEVIFCYFTRVYPTWEVTCFFVLQGTCVVIEILVKKAVAFRWQLHQAVTGPLTVGFVSVTSFWLYFPPVIRNGVDEKIMQEYPIMIDFIKANFGNLLSRKLQLLS